MLDILRINSRIKQIRRRVVLLDRDIKSIGREMFIVNEKLQAQAERHLQVAIQACIDIAVHIVSAMGLNMPEDKISDVFFSLAEEKIIPGEFAHKMIEMAGYRNILVHEYLEVDSTITYRNIQENLGDFSEFVKYIQKFLDSRKN